MEPSNVFGRISRHASRFWICVIGLVLLALVVGFQRPPGGPDNIVIKDSKGQKRIELGVFGDEPGLIMYDKNGQPRVRLEMLEEEGEDISQTYLRFTAPNDEAYTAEFGANYIGGKRSERSSWVNLVGPRGSHLAMKAGPIPRIELQGDKPELGALALHVAGGAPRISLRDKEGKQRISMQLTKESLPEIQCHDATRKVIWQAPPEMKKSSADKPKKERQDKKEEQEKK
jgi:hypothetical protein